MRRIITLVVLLCVIAVTAHGNSAPFDGQAAGVERAGESTASALAVAGERFVAMAPCRLLDTRSDRAKTPGEELARTLKMSSTRCAAFIPGYAAAYAVRVINLRREGPDKGPVQVGLAPLARLPRDPSDLLQFAVPASSHLAVDVEGYYVPPGIPLDAMDGAAAVAKASEVEKPAENAAQGMLRVTPQSVHQTPDRGELFLDASTPFTAAGARLEGSEATPYTVLRPGHSGGAIAFYAAGATPVELMAFLNDGQMRLGSTAFINGRFDYQPQPNQRVPANIVNNVLLNYPLDTNGGANDRVVFFNAKTVEEAIAQGGTTSGPPTTKFQAYTTGNYSGQPNINFDSQIYYHTNQYHFRAYSGAEQKATFWIKAAPSAAGDTVAGTRAKMFVSGPAGFGTDDPLDPVHIKGASPALRLEEASTAGSTALVGNDSALGPYLVSHTGPDWKATIGASAHRVRFGANVLAIEDAASVGVGSTRTFIPRLQIDSTGQVIVGTTENPTPLKVNGGLTVTGDITGARVINAIFQDVAEWVPATEEMPPGTVVVVEQGVQNTVAPSSRAYDTRVAGVVSAQPGVILGVGGDAKEMIATTGRVKVRVDAARGPIEAGDLLVTSDKPGVAMRSEPIDLGGAKIHRPGTLIGKALEPLERGEGEILVLLSLQ